MAWAVIRPPLTTETRVRSQVTPSEANVRQIVTETGLSRSTSLLSYQYDTTSATYLYFLHLPPMTGDRGSTVGKVLCYKSLVRSQLVSVDFSLT